MKNAKWPSVTKHRVFGPNPGQTSERGRINENFLYWKGGLKNFLLDAKKGTVQKLLGNN
jgi:hypothetical protein